VIAANDKLAWMKEKKDWLKDNRWKDILGALRPCLEPAHVSDSEAPVRACFRCISKHSNFLDYKGALAAGLPIGSGEIDKWPPRCDPEPAQDRRGLVEGGKLTKDDRSTGLASERRLGRLLEQRASCSCITTFHYTQSYLRSHSISRPGLGLRRFLQRDWRSLYSPI
jgi:hypothetical protein